MSHSVDSSLLAQLHQRTSSKWRKYDASVLPMHVAEMDFDVADKIKQEIITRVQRGDLGYLGPIPELGPAFSGFAQRRWGWHLDPERISLAADVGVAAIEISRVLTNPGDSVLINSPVYNNFYTWIEESKLNLVDVPLRRTESTWELDIAGIEKAFQSGIKIFLLSNPQNPVGRVHRKQELEQIAELANKYGVAVISDEIHAALTYQDLTFTPYLSIPAAAEWGYTITSASKAWNIAGLKAAMIIPGSSSAAIRINKVPTAVHWRTSIIGAFAMVSAFNSGDAWLNETLSQLDSNRKNLKDLLKQELPNVGYHIPESSYLAWLDLTAYGSNASWHDQILSRGKVSIVPGQDYGKAYPNFIRLNFATYPEVLTEGIQRIAQALS
ncbi:MAG: MalY/PatB family protein [Candidatus Nanopelagicales bacterium]